MDLVYHHSFMLLEDLKGSYVHYVSFGFLVSQCEGPQDSLCGVHWWSKGNKES